MIAAYGAYSASATGGNGFSRDFLAGVLTLPATPFYTNIGSRPLQNASTILACIAFLVTIPVYVFYFYGAWFRTRSPFAESLITARQENGGRRVSSLGAVRRLSVQAKSNPGSRTNSIAQVPRADAERAQL